VQRASALLDVGDLALAGADQFVRFDAEHVVPRSRRGSHLVVLQQIGIDEDAQLSAVAKRWHAVFGLGNSLDQPDDESLKPHEPCLDSGIQAMMKSPYFTRNRNQSMVSASDFSSGVAWSPNVDA
jgi:hypothetical protein